MFVLGLLLLASVRVSAQVVPGTKTADATRAQLVEMARVADSLGRKSESFVLQNRLTSGDFAIGDRLWVTYEGIGLQKADTLVVTEGQVIRLGEPMGDLSLHGMLRSEVRDSIANRVAKYYKNIVVNVKLLLRLSVSGVSRSSGFFYAPSDTRLADILTRLVGQDASADFGATVIKRGDRIIWAAADVQTALTDGATLAGLDLEPGDEIVVGARNSNTGSRRLLIMQVGIPLVSAVLLQMIYGRR